MTNIISISGQICAGSSSVAKILSDKLSLNYFSPGTYIKNRLESNKINHIIDAYDNDLKSKHKQNAIDRLQQIIAKKGNIIIDGKLSIYILKNISTINIWLYANKSCRIKRLSKRDNLSLVESKYFLDARELKEKNTWEEMYKINLSNMHTFADLTFNTSIYTADEITNIIITKLKKNYE